MGLMILLLAALAAYLIGSIPFAVVVSRAMGLPDPRSYGSGNPGTTNVLRSGSRVAALLTLLGDAAKGWFAVWLALRFEMPPETVAVVAVAVFLGHVFPVWLRFKGGKGVATAAGILLAMDWRIGLWALLTWVVVALVSRYSSLAAIVAAALSPVISCYYLGWGPLTWAVAVMALMLIWRHRANIARLAAGREGRIRLSKRP
jgi:glycerol-3-phosphate acyltransferase PlsY